MFQPGSFLPRNFPLLCNAHNCQRRSAAQTRRRSLTPFAAVAVSPTLQAGDRRSCLRPAAARAGSPCLRLHQGGVLSVCCRRGPALRGTGVEREGGGRGCACVNGAASSVGGNNERNNSAMQSRASQHTVTILCLIQGRPPPHPPTHTHLHLSPPLRNLPTQLVVPQRQHTHACQGRPRGRQLSCNVVLIKSDELKLGQL